MKKMKGMYSTQAHILQTAITLMEKKGYKGVTTKEIAEESGFSEMTLFRYFGTKQMLLEKAVEKYSSIYNMIHAIQKNLVYDLMIDLMMVSDKYQKHLEKNKRIELIAIQERNTNPYILEKTTESANCLKEFLIEYFQEMQLRNKLVKIDCELCAMNFLWLNIGFFFTKHIAGQYVSTVPSESFIYKCITQFVQGLEAQEELVAQFQYS